MVTTAENRFPLVVQAGGERLELDPPPGLNRGFSELREVVFLGPSEAGCRLLVDDAPLAEVAAGKPRRWTWTPGFYAGEVRADLVSADGRRLGTWRLDVSPDARKLGRDLFFEMLAELLDFDPSLVVGKEPARQRFGALGPGQDPLVALARLRTRQTPIRQALRALLREPKRALRARRRLVPPHRIRRADRRTAQAALRQPALLAAMGRIDSLDLTSPAGELMADVPEVERHYDSPANRCLLAMLQALQRRCAGVRAELERKVEAESRSDTATGLLRRWPTWKDFLRGMRQELLAAARRQPFCEVSRPEVTAAGLNAVSGNPLYARFWRLAWEALRTGIDGLECEDLLPLSPTWEIYERWCFVELSRHLKTLLPDLEWRRTSRQRFDGRGRGDLQLCLRLQPSFANTSGQEKPGFWSISGQRFPDIVLSWEHRAEAGFLVLDAKYRVTRENVLDAMSSAHLYQDSLRMGRRRPIASLLLVPASGGAPWLESPDFVAEHRVGVAALRPGSPPPSWLSSLLQQARSSRTSVPDPRADGGHPSRAPSSSSHDRRSSPG